MNQIGASITAQQAPSKTNWRRLFGLRERGVYYALLLLIVVLTIITTYLGQANYLSVLNLSNVVYQSSLIAIMAVAMTVVLISGNFDLSVASVAALRSRDPDRQCRRDRVLPAAALAMTVAMGIGLLNGVIVQYRRHQCFHCYTRHDDSGARPGIDLYRWPLALGFKILTSSPR